MPEKTNDYPDPDQLLPQAGEMNLLNDLVEHNSEYSTCRFTVSPDHVFARNGTVPVWFGIEFMGQCSFYHYQLKRHDDNESTVNALFLGGRNITLNQHLFQPNTPYIVYAKDFGVSNRFFAAETYIHPEGNSENKIIHGRLSALIFDNSESLLDPPTDEFT